MEGNYTTNELAELLGVTPRTIQRHLATLRDMLSASNKHFDVRVLDILKVVFDYNLSDTETTYDRIEYFTEDEYQEFHKRLVEYPLFQKHIENLKDEIEHHKSQYEKLVHMHNDFIQAHKSSLKIIEQRNYIEANDKNFK